MPDAILEGSIRKKLFTGPCSQRSAQPTPLVNGTILPRSILMVLRVVIFLILLSISNQYTANADILDQYEIKDRLQNVRMIYMVDPQIILGRRDEKHGLYKGDEPGVRMAQRAILHSAADVFVQQGYGFTSTLDDDANILFSPEYQQKLQIAWKHLDQFADAGKEKKPKLWPFSIVPDHESFTRDQQIDAIAFVQCYGKFDSAVAPDAEVTGKVAIAIVEAALVGSAVIFRGDYATLEFKLSVIDSKTGELIFYRESLEVDTDVRDQARLMHTFTAAFKWYLPKAANPVPLVKFKHRRSEITAQTINGGLNAPKL